MVIWTYTGHNTAPLTSLSYGLPFPGSRNKARFAFNVRGDGKWIAIIGRDNGYLVGAYYDVPTTRWIEDATVVNGIGGIDHGSFPTPELAYDLRGDNKWVLIVGNSPCNPWFGYYWDSVNSIWVTDTAIKGGLQDDGGRATAAIAHNLHPTYEWILINGNDNGQYTAYWWNGASWVKNNAIANGLTDKGSLSSPVIGYNLIGDNKWFLITGENGSNDDLYGFTWDGINTWSENTDLLDGFSDGSKAESFPGLAKDFTSDRRWALFVDSSPYGGSRSFAGPYTEHTISGNVKDSDGNNLNNVAITFENSTNYSTNTDVNGNYSQIVDVGIYTVTASKSSYLSSSASVDATTSNQTQNFVLSKPVISGNIKDNKGYNINGVVVTFTNDTSYKTTTDSDGNYSQEVDTDEYTVVASLAGYTSSSADVNATAGDQTQDFILDRTTAPHDKGIYLGDRYLINDLRP